MGLLSAMVWHSMLESNRAKGKEREREREARKLRKQQRKASREQRARYAPEADAAPYSPHYRVRVEPDGTRTRIR